MLTGTHYAGELMFNVMKLEHFCFDFNGGLEYVSQA